MLIFLRNVDHIFLFILGGHIGWWIVVICSLNCHDSINIRLLEKAATFKNKCDYMLKYNFNITVFPV